MCLPLWNIVLSNSHTNIHATVKKCTVHSAHTFEGERNTLCVFLADTTKCGSEIFRWFSCVCFRDQNRDDITPLRKAGICSMRTQYEFFCCAKILHAESASLYLCWHIRTCVHMYILHSFYICVYNVGCFHRICLKIVYTQHECT